LPYGCYRPKIVMFDSWGDSECRFNHNYGLVRGDRMWISGDCGGIFQVQGEGQHYYYACHAMYSLTEYKECDFVEDHLKTVVYAPPDPAPKHLAQHCGQPFALLRKPAFRKSMPSLMERWRVSQMHASADQLIPQARAWSGDAGLNAVYYKFSKRSWPLVSAKPLSGEDLFLEWAWLWRTEWRGLLGSGSIRRSPFLRAKVTYERNGLRLAQIFDVLLFLARSLGPPLPISFVRVASWWQASRLFRRAVASAKASTHRYREGQWRAAALAQRAVSRLTLAKPPAQALREVPLIRYVLPAARRLALLLARPRMPRGSQGSRQRKRGRRVATPRSGFRLPAIGALTPQKLAADGSAPWDPGSAEGWYLYRLAACDPTV